MQHLPQIVKSVCRCRCDVYIVCVNVSCGMHNAWGWGGGGHAHHGKEREKKKKKGMHACTLEDLLVDVTTPRATLALAANLLQQPVVPTV